MSITSNILKRIQSTQDFEIRIECSKCSETKPEVSVIPANRTALIASSKYFAEYFTSDKTPAENIFISFSGKDINVMKKIVHFLHGKQIDLSDKDVVEFIVESNYFDIDFCDDYCRSVFQSIINSKNVY